MTHLCHKDKELLAYVCDIPMCHSELGPGTEYDLLAVICPPQRNAVLIGSVDLIHVLSLTLSLDTQYPIARNWPITIVSPFDDPHGTLNDDQLRTVMTQLRREQPYSSTIPNSWRRL